MTPVTGTIFGSQGHPRGGLFLVWLALAACGPSTSSPGAGVGAPAASALLPDPLRVYRELGYLAGDQRFAAVGKFVFLPGPADSSYAIMTLSLPNAALRFRREPPGFAARYEVDLSLGDSTAPIAQLSQVEEVRVRTFRETSRRDESVVFQGFLTLAPGVYAGRLRVHDAGSSAGFAADVELEVPRFAVPSVTAPMVVHRVEPRGMRSERPALILSPRATVVLGGEAVQVYVESLAGSERAVILEARLADQVVWSDTLSTTTTDGSLHTARTSLKPDRLPAGALILSTRLAGTAATDSAVLVVGLTADWLAVEYEEALGYLRYAGSRATLDSLRSAPPGERGRLLNAFWKSRDPDPETVGNEFFDVYFRRIQDANARFLEASSAGWLTDRGAVYVTLGPPDEVLHDLEARQGPGRSQIWLYGESLDFDLRLAFVDTDGTGVYVLTAESRRAFAEAVKKIYS